VPDTGPVGRIVAATDSSDAGRRLRLRIACCWLTGCGLVLVIVGSFLPWVVSGSVKRSSYAIVGVVDRLGIAGDGVLAALIALWPFIGVLCFAPVIAALLRRWRIAGVLATLIGLFAAALALGILFVGVGRTALTVRLDPLGPTVMAAGGLLLLGGGLCMSFGNSSPIRRTNGRSDPMHRS
jgi:hypothetical protein